MRDDLAAKAADYYEGVKHIRFCEIRNEVAKSFDCQS